MSVVEIVLLVVGVLCLAAGFFLPEKEKPSEDKRDDDKRIKELVDKEVDKARERIEDMVDETVNYSIEKTERALERLSNEKIMAVDEYSETVLKKINDNHQEAVFLYDMLNDKDEKLKTSGDELKAKDDELKARDDELRLKEGKQRIKELEAELKLKDEESRKAKEEADIARAEAEKAKEETFVPFIPERISIIDEASSGEDNPASEAKEAKEEKKAKAPSKARKTTMASKNEEDRDEVELHFLKSDNGTKNKNEEIKRLHEEGKSNMAIARELGLGIGEVKLVIDLFSQRK